MQFVMLGETPSADERRLSSTRTLNWWYPRVVPCMRTLKIEGCVRDRRPSLDFPVRLKNDMQKPTSVACLAMEMEVHGVRSRYVNGRLDGRLGICYAISNIVIGRILEYLCDDACRWH